MKGHSGINIFKKLIECVNKPIVKIDKLIVMDKNKIKIRWLVKAIPKGIKLNKLQIKTKLKIVKMNGK